MDSWKTQKSKYLENKIMFSFSNKVFHSLDIKSYIMAKNNILAEVNVKFLAQTFLHADSCLCVSSIKLKIISSVAIPTAKAWCFLFFIFNSFILAKATSSWVCNSADSLNLRVYFLVTMQGRIQNPVELLRWNYFRKKLHLRCSRGF